MHSGRYTRASPSDFRSTGAYDETKSLRAVRVGRGGSQGARLGRGPSQKTNGSVGEAW
jgi:hypothetical protein